MKMFFKAGPLEEDIMPWVMEKWILPHLKYKGMMKARTISLYTKTPAYNVSLLNLFVHEF